MVLSLRTVKITLLFISLIWLSPVLADDARIDAELQDTSKLVIPLEQALGKATLDEAMATGKYVYIGNLKCRLCHRDFFLGRKGDVHDHAFEKIAKSSHKNNERCLGCHTTGYGVKSGFKSMTKTPRLANVQCEGCHGPGSDHMRKNAMGGFLAGTDQPEILKKMCHACHNERWNKSFSDFDTAYDGYKTAKPSKINKD